MGSAGFLFRGRAYAACWIHYREFLPTIGSGRSGMQGVALGGEVGQRLPTILVDLAAQRLRRFEATLRTQIVAQCDRNGAAVQIAREAEQMGFGQPRARLNDGRTRTHVDHRPEGLSIDGDGGDIDAVAQVGIGGHGNVGRREAPLPADAIAGHDRPCKRMEYHGLRQLVGI